MYRGIQVDFQNSAKLRDEINRVESYEELEQLLEERLKEEI